MLSTFYPSYIVCFIYLLLLVIILLDTRRLVPETQYFTTIKPVRMISLCRVYFGLGHVDVLSESCDIEPYLVSNYHKYQSIDL